ncbi:Bax inhibitor-1/YccA family protein [bacterium]|nr:Bax inhibitor-1/YccA family protein [bacterium]
MSNPILNSNFGAGEHILEAEPMTISGTVNKTLILSVFLTIGAACNWHFIAAGFIDKASMLVTAGAIIGLILAIIISFNVKMAKYLSPIYAIMEGLCLGGISAMFEAQYSGIVFQTIGATVTTLIAMLFLYRTGTIRYTEKMGSILKTAMLSILIIYLIQFVASFFSRGIPLIFGNGPVGILFSAFVCLVAAFCLIQDFYFIETGAERMLPKDFEWYGAFGLMVTLVWLYMEFLRLFAKLNSRR